jgi:type II secretory pathway pseudopilin PulG
MSLPTNLATRPFYNERAVQGFITVIAAVVMAATLFNLWQLATLTQRERAFTAARAAADAKIDSARRQAGRARSGLDRDRLAAVADAVREANVVIDGRTFSWTALFNWLETALPADVRIVAIRPRTDTDGRFVLGLTVEARTVTAIDTFISRLESTNRFRGLLVRTERETDDGTIEATVEGEYQREPPVSGAAR